MLRADVKSNISSSAASGCLKTVSISCALTLLVGSFDPQKPSPKWPIMCLVGR